MADVKKSSHSSGHELGIGTIFIILIIVVFIIWILTGGPNKNKETQTTTTTQTWPANSEIPSYGFQE